MNFPATPNARVCVLFPGALGDFICFLPTLVRLANSHAVDLLARAEFAGIVADGIQVSSLERLEVRQLFVDDGASDAQAEKFFAGYSAVYSWFASSQASFVERLRIAAQGRARCFAFRPAEFSGHQADYYLACLHLPAADSAQPLIALRPEAVRWREAFLLSHGVNHAPLLMVAPGSGAREKNWPVENFAEVARWWRKQVGGKVVAIVGPVEEERGGFEPLAESCVIARGLDLAQLAALLSQSQLFLGNDSGVSHLAAAVGARTVALFGPSDERQWAPRGPRVTLLRRQGADFPGGGESSLVPAAHGAIADLAILEVLNHLKNLLAVSNLTWFRAGITV